MSTPDPLRLLPVSDAAAALGVGGDTLRRWLDDGAIPFVLVGSDRRVSRLMLEEWQRGLVEQREQRSRETPRPLSKRRRVA